MDKLFCGVVNCDEPILLEMSEVSQPCAHHGLLQGFSVSGGGAPSIQLVI